ncbi:MAG TPA: DnaB-like helicase N-terminal domain-containing protein, partial [Chitinivibrionales bacterium]
MISRPAESAQISDRIPPQALDVERTVLGSMLIDANAAVNAMEKLTEDCFYSSANQQIFICLREMFEKSIPFDIITLAEELRKKTRLEAVGAESYLAQLVDNVATSANIEYHVKILMEKSTLRSLISASADITTSCFSTEAEAQDILDNAEAKIFGISEARIKNSFESLGQLLPKTFEDIDKYSKGGVQGIPTGFKELDELTSG